jgi:EmrB/QacA subfamily drug resistance transporter
MEPKKRTQIMLVLFFGVLMGALDIAIVGPALPSIRKQFSAEVAERAISWIFSIYVLFNLIGTPLMAKLSDMYGRRMIYVLDVLLFATGSLVVAVSTSFTTVLIGRAIQGFGAGGIFPVASAVIGDTFPQEKRGSALGLIGAVFGIAFIIGPILGGIILSIASWHWLFLINLPIAAVLVISALRTLPNQRPGKLPTFDWLGMLLIAGSLAALAYGINQIDTTNFFGSLATTQVWPFLLGAVVLGILLAVVEARVAAPILRPRLFKRRQMKLAYVLSAGAGIGESGLVFLPLLAVAALGAQFGVNEKSASFLLMPVVLAMAFGSPLVGRMLDKVGSRQVILFGTVVLAGGLFLLSLQAQSLLFFILSGVLIGLGLSALLGAPIRYIMLNESAADERSTAQGVASLFTSIGQLVGAALVGAVAASRIDALQSAESRVAGYTTAFLVIAVVTVILIVLATFLQNRAAERETVRNLGGAPAPLAVPPVPVRATGKPKSAKPGRK